MAKVWLQNYKHLIKRGHLKKPSGFYEEICTWDIINKYKESTQKLKEVMALSYLNLFKNIADSQKQAEVSGKYYGLFLARVEGVYIWSKIQYGTGPVAKKDIVMLNDKRLHLNSLSIKDNDSSQWKCFTPKM